MSKCKTCFTFTIQNDFAMNSNYLLPNKFKNIGWWVLVPSAIFGVISLLTDFEPDIFNFDLPALFINDFNLFGDRRLFGMVNNNFLNEIVGVLIIISSLCVAFSKEKLEDEYISKIRLDSLVWAVYLNYAILLFSFLCIYDLSFLYVMIFNMFTVLVFFMIRFNWQISKLERTTEDEE